MGKLVPIEYNKKKFGRRIEQLKVIVEDESYIPKESSNGYHVFIKSMYVALTVVCASVSRLKSTGHTLPEIK